MKLRRQAAALSATMLVLASGWLVLAEEKKQLVEQERAVKENEVPAVALNALKKVAGGAALTEFAEEIEHGHKFYEGSWKGPAGNVDALVTEAGDLVEVEEVVPVEQVPAQVRAEAEKQAGKNAKVMYEKKTLILYEVHFAKDGKGKEMILTPDARRFHEEGAKDEDKDEDEGK